MQSLTGMVIELRNNSGQKAPQCNKCIHIEFVLKPADGKRAPSLSFWVSFIAVMQCF